ncbi:MULTISPECIES: DUF3558 domain-containing protein [unclassified Crossiella]|uniref:DUF3558 domain-containing protein n=1 Tax=unclassified Crossiella TaxID=2620835 RepID=UPI001FFFB44E|nr:MULTISPECIES: DUF3558 domain-containing protein [unclassified Crossiella]MCK2240514.1 DUF3558 domain-containing protein [Crossiella sp. S99.2]MCK2253035.1 DUF3558 domain-containing protein [Crossiella sp. S99.1]
MTTTSIRWAAASGLLILLAGCGTTSVGGTPTTPSASPVPKVDACTVLNEQELSSIGQPAQPHEKLDKRGEVGCSWQGPDYGVALTVDAARKLEEYLNKPQGTYVKSQLNSINGRRGFLSQAFKGNDECAEFMELGGGLFNIRLTYAAAYAGKGDPCVDVERVAKLVEPKLPK